MSLTELEPQFVKAWVEAARPNGWARGWSYVDAIELAEGLQFLCPACVGLSGGAHSILCWSPKAPPDMVPGPGRWHLEGAGYDDLTLRGVHSDSVLLTSGCRAHFFVRNGRIEMC